MLQKRITIVVLALLSITCKSLADDPPQKSPVTLMGMVSEWRYPDSLFQGAETSDAAVKDIVSMKSKAALTTSDSAEKVVAFYQQKLNVDSSGKTLGVQGQERVLAKRAVSIQENSAGRPLKLYIISIHEQNSTTTLVISRLASDETTHIAWSNYQRIRP